MQLWCLLNERQHAREHETPRRVRLRCLVEQGHPEAEVDIWNHEISPLCSSKYTDSMQKRPAKARARKGAQTWNKAAPKPPKIGRQNISEYGGGIRGRRCSSFLTPPSVCMLGAGRGEFTAEPSTPLPRFGYRRGARSALISVTPL